MPKSQIGIMGKRTALLNVSPDHVIAQAGSFRIILNKYCAVKNQILLTSILPRSQSETLDACELASVYRTLKALPRNHLAFYNCGKDGGASQPHKHVQIAPLELDVFQDLFPNKVISRSGRDFHWVFSGLNIVDILVVSQDASKQSALIQHPDVPYAHFIVRTAGECTGEYLQSLFNTLLSATKSALGSQLDDAQPTPAYNFLMTSDWMMMIPRTNAACNGVGVNAVGMLGILWLESDGQLQALNNIGFDDALVYVGLRKAEVEV